MSRITGISGKAMMKFAEERGWRLARVRGDHFVYRHSDLPGNLSIPDHKELSTGVLHSLIKLMGLTVNEFLEALGRR